MRLNVVGYARVSTEEQATDGVSLASQREKVRGYRRLYDLELVTLVEGPGESAKTLDRPGLAQVLALLDEGVVGGVAVARLDRLTRSVADLAILLDRYLETGPNRVLCGGFLDWRDGRLQARIPRDSGPCTP